MHETIIKKLADTKIHCEALLVNPNVNGFITVAMPYSCEDLQNQSNALRENLTDKAYRLSHITNSLTGLHVFESQDYPPQALTTLCVCLFVCVATAYHFIFV